MRGERRPVFYGYVIVAAAFVLSFASGPGQSFSFSVFQPEILRETGLSATGFSFIYAIGSGVSALAVLVLGPALDRFGSRAVTMVLALLFLAAAGGMALARGFLSLLLALALLRAIGQGCLMTTSQFLTSQWFVLRRGYALSLATMGVVTANAILPPLTYVLIGKVGWRATYLWTGGVIGATLLAMAGFLIRNRPEDLGLHPDGAAEPLPEVSPGELARNGAPGAAWKTRRFWGLVIPLAATPFVSTATMFHQVSLFESRGLSAQDSAIALTILAVAAAAGTLSAGWCLARLGVRNTTLLMQGLVAVALALLFAANSQAMATAYSVALGASLGLWSVTAGATWPHYYGRDGLGKVQGTAGMVLLVSSALAPLPIASLHASTGSHQPGLGFLLVLAVLALVITAPRKRLAS